MRKNINKAAALLAATMLFTGCSNVAPSVAPEAKNSGTKELTANVSSNVTGITEVNEIDKNVFAGLGNFSVRLFKESVRNSLKNNENVLISPESVLFALGMTVNGAEDDTKEAMLNCLSGKVDLDALNANMYYLLHNQSKENSKFKMKIANSIWFDDVNFDLTMRDEFLTRTKGFYDAAIYKANLQEAIDDINGWISEKTDKMIPKMLDEINPETIMLLINAITFDAGWADEYTEYQVNEHGKFTAFDGSVQEATMLTGEENVYLFDENTTGFLKYYDDRRYAFMAMLPEEGISLSDYVESMTEDKLIKLIEGRKSGESIIVHTLMPEFTLDYDLSMKDALKAMGMEIAFDGKHADFSGMISEEDNNKYDELFISDVLHKTHIELDRKGTKAAAATVVMMDCKATAIMEEPEIYNVKLDRPFAYAIVDMATELPVFIGAVNSIN